MFVEMTGSSALVYGQTIDQTGVIATSETSTAGVMTLINNGTSVGTIAVGTSLSTGNFTLQSDGSTGTDVIVNTVFGSYSSGVTLLSNPTTIAGTATAVRDRGHRTDRHHLDADQPGQCRRNRCRQQRWHRVRR